MFLYPIASPPGHADVRISGITSSVYSVYSHPSISEKDYDIYTLGLYGVQRPLGTLDNLCRIYLPLFLVPKIKGLFPTR